MAAAAYIFRVFDAPDLVPGVDFGIARSGGQYAVVFAKGNGMLVSRRFSTLNTEGTTELSAAGRPLIWFDAAIDRDPRNLGPACGTLQGLLAASPPVIRLTGRARGETQEVEILLNEDDLARVCQACGTVEAKTEERRWERHAGEGYDSLYWCGMCANSSVRRAFQFILHSLSGSTQ
ncbi:hypothetical protein AURDEDRAFT_139331 [Auricularia subglabra TFB-10046 SS5]|nr:hypothetical protein AURDEDRAFT_139331 [Auricularia subglabra TFB-10046 SS5]